MLNLVILCFGISNAFSLRKLSDEVNLEVKLGMSVDWAVCRSGQEVSLNPPTYQLVL